MIFVILLLTLVLLPIAKLQGKEIHQHSFYGEGTSLRLKDAASTHFRLHRDLLSQKDADDQCKKSGGKLASFPSHAQWDSIQEQLQNEHADADAKVDEGFKKPCQNDWVAGRRAADGTWSWADGEVIAANDRFWAEGQPALGKGLDCLSRQGFHETGKSLFATDCSDAHWFVCEEAD